MHLLEEELASANLSKELLKEQGRKSLLELVRTRTKAKEDEAQFKETIRGLREVVEGWKCKCQDIADSDEEQVNVATAETSFWKDKFFKLARLANQALKDIPQSLREAEGMADFMKMPREITKRRTSAPNHQYHTRARTRHMKQAIDELEQQNIQTRAEVGQIRENMGEIKEQLNKVFELLTRNVPPFSLLPPPRGPLLMPQLRELRHIPRMPLGWNVLVEAQVAEEPEAVEASRPLPQATQATVSLPPYAYPPGHPGQTRATFRSLEATSVQDEKISSLEQRVRIIEGTGGHGLDATDLCLMSDVALPADFKTPKFEKYKGSSCPRVHLAMYCRKMAAYIQQDKILVHCFQDSLTRAALNWYVNLEKGQVKTWRDLAEAFIRQYRYNKDMAPDQSRL
ncbi:hypothetical protein CR513_54717, partial [Mucuna pruriens]